MNRAPGKRTAWLLSAGLLLSSGAFACTQAAPAPAVVARSFELTVSDSHRAPLRGIRVALGTLDHYNMMHPLLRATSDANGSVHFQSAPVGSFTLQFTDSLGEHQYRDVSVVKTGGADSLQYNWPYVNWIPLRSASAILKQSDQPLRHYQVSLQSVPDGNVLGISDTDRFGRFDLPADRPGRYAVEVLKPDSINGTAASLGKILIDVTGEERLPALDTIYLAETSCGLQSDHICRATPPAVESSCVHVVDWSGGEVPEAFAKLTLKSGAVIREELKANGKANLELSEFAPGDYELQIFATGFAPSLVAVHKTPEAAACDKPVVVAMNVIGYGCQPPE